MKKLFFHLAINILPLEELALFPQIILKSANISLTRYSVECKAGVFKFLQFNKRFQIAPF